VRPFEGDLEEYRRLLLARKPAKNGENGDTDDKNARRAERRAAAERRRVTEPLRRRLRAAEDRVATLTRDLGALDTQLADPTTYGNDGAELTFLLRRQAELRETLHQAESDWLAAAEALEAGG
ncbi:MAG: ABC transporter ATP-binding protein, partial [Roseiarcus sp.]